MDSIGLGIPECKDMHETGRVVTFLPDVVPKCTRLVGTHIGHELVDGFETALERFGSHLVAGELPDLLSLVGGFCHDCSFPCSVASAAIRMRSPSGGWS